MRKALEDQDFENIKSYLLEGNEAALPAHQKLMLDRWVAASKLLDKNPVMKNAVAILRLKFPGLSRTQAYEDCRNAIQMFNSKKDFDFDLWRNWLLDDIIKLCIKARESGDLKSWALAQRNLIAALGEAPAQDIDPKLLENHPIVIPIQVNNNTYNVDFNKFLSLSIDQRTKLADALVAPATDEDIIKIMKS